MNKEIKELLDNSKQFFDDIPDMNNPHSCCFCMKSIIGYGNSTWPIYYQNDGEVNRCCDECNNNYVIPARNNKTLIMKFREQFHIDYTDYN